MVIDRRWKKWGFFYIPLTDIIRDFQLGNTPWALILTYPTFLIPFCTWLLMGYFKTIPKELEECARIDGATRFGAMTRIIFPIAVPGILSAGIFAFTLSWNEFIYALIFLSSPERKTRSEEHTSELQSRQYLVCRLLLEKKNLNLTQGPYPLHA